MNIKRMTLTWIGVMIGAVAVVLVNVAAIITHIVWCIKHIEQGWEAIAFLIIGIVPLPLVGILHGWSLWFGVEWVTGWAS